MCKSKIIPEAKEQLDSYVDDDIAITIGMGLYEANAQPLEVKDIQAIKKRIVDRIRELVNHRDEFIEIMQSREVSL